MLVTLKHISLKQRKGQGAAMLFVLVSLLSYEKLAFYVRFDFNFILLLLVLPFVLKQKGHGKSNRYAYPAILLFGAYFYVQLSTIFFFAFVCSLFFLYESTYGKLSSIPLFLVIVVSPIAIYFSEIIGFEIRLSLTQAAVKILNFTGAGYSAKGNIISRGDKEFRVDPECMGLSMILLSFFIALVFISFRQKEKNTDFGVLTISILLLTTFLLDIISNTIRIVVITLFDSPPGSISHDMIGVICFLMYVVLPLWAITRVFKGKIKAGGEDGVERNFKQAVKYVLLGIILLQLLVYNIFKNDLKGQVRVCDSQAVVKGEKLEKSNAPHGVLKLTNDEMLMYVKPSVNFYSSEHSPLICWKGSGYKIKNEQKLLVGEYNVYYGELYKENEVLHTVWWYDSGNYKTTSQLTWRTRQYLRNEKYRLVNIICSSKETLTLKTTKIIHQDLFEN